jgi:hypothetical protein
VLTGDVSKVECILRRFGLEAGEWCDCGDGTCDDGWMA